MKIIISFLISAVLLLLQSCSPTVRTRVDSMSAKGAELHTKYVLYPGNKGCDENDLQYRVFAGYTENALDQVGFSKAENPDDADVCIFLSYGRLGPKFFQYTYSQPVWGQVGMSAQSVSSYKTGRNAAMYSRFTTYQPTYGIVGTTTHVGAKAYYKTYLKLAGYDYTQFKLDGKEVLLWKTEVSSNLGRKHHLREIFPAMLISAQEHIADNLDMPVYYDVSLHDERIELLK